MHDNNGDDNAMQLYSIVEEVSFPSYPRISTHCIHMLYKVEMTPE